jgi:uncharacterized RDD family membrane protein YckC
MNWFYAEGSQQKGPVSEYDLAGLVRQGIVKPEMLIWREGLPDWQPLSQARPDLVASSDAPVLGGIAVPEQSKDLMVQQMREGALMPGGVLSNPYGLRYAGFWIRVAAWIIDYIVMMIVVVPLRLLILGSVGLFGGDFLKRMSANDPQALGALLAASGAASLLTFANLIAYNGHTGWKWGATLGKMAVGVKVVTPEGGKLSLGRSIGRAAADLINYFICFLTYLMAAFDEPEKRALQDHIAGTRVVFK